MQCLFIVFTKLTCTYSSVLQDDSFLIVKQSNEEKITQNVAFIEKCLLNLIELLAVYIRQSLNKFVCEV